MSNEENQTADGKSEPSRERANGRWLLLLTVLLSVLFIGSGLIGHAPWKLTEIQSLETAQTMANSGDLVVLMQAEKPAVSTPPLYFMTAAGLVKGLSEYIPQADAARVATGLYLAVTLLFAGLLGRTIWQPAETKGVGSTGAMTALIMLGTLGIVWFGHDVASDSALAAGFTMGLYGLLLLPRRILMGGLWFGTGLGIAFMAKGLLGPAILLITAVLMPFFATFGGIGRQLRGLIVGLLFAAPWLLIWPWMLYQRDPQLLNQWFSGDSVQLYLDHIAIHGREHNFQWLWTFLIMTCPAWLLAGLALILRPGAFFGLPGVRIAILTLTVGWAALLTVDGARPIDALMLMAPLAALGAGSITRMPGQFVLAMKWVSALLFSLVAFGLWGLWLYLRFQGQLPEVPQLAALIPADYRFAFESNLYLVAAFLTVLWLWASMRFLSPRPSALLAWPTGVAMTWALIVLHQPLVDRVLAERGLIQDPEIGVTVTLQKPAPAGSDSAPTAPAGAAALVAPAMTQPVAPSQAPGTL